MAKRTAKQQKILEAISRGGDIQAEIKEISENPPREIPDGPRTYMGLPGTTIIGAGNFPLTTDDPAMQEKIEGSRSFKAGHVWIDDKTDEERAAVEKAVSGFSFPQLRKLAVALGHRDIGRLSKLQLIEVCTKDGASLL